MRLGLSLGLGCGGASSALALISYPTSNDVLAGGASLTISGSCTVGVAPFTVRVGGVSIGNATVVGTSWTRVWTPVNADGEVVVTTDIGGSVSPYVLANAVFAVDASKTTSYTDTGGALTSLVNLASGVSMSSITGAPTIATDPVTGFKYFSFDGASHIIGTEAAVLATINGTNKPHTAFVVTERTASIDVNGCYFGAGLSTNVGSTLNFIETAAGYGVEKGAGTTGPVRDWLPLGHIAEGVTRLCYYTADGLTEGFDQNGSAQTPITQTSPGAVSSDRFAVGCNPRPTPGFILYGRVHQILFTSDSKSTPVRAAVDAKLSAKWRRPASVSLLGDSLTAATGTAPAGGWRRAFYDWVVAQGLRVDFQGRISSGTGTWDNRHNGVSGNTMAQISTRVDTYYGATGQQPLVDLVCLLTLTNDAGLGSGPAITAYIALCKKILGLITATVPTAKLCVSTISDINGSAWPETVNALLPAAWANVEGDYPGHLLYWDDFNALGGSRSTDYPGGDSTHPGEADSQLMFTAATYGMQQAVAPYLTSIG